MSVTLQKYINYIPHNFKSSKDSLYYEQNQYDLQNNTGINPAIKPIPKHLNNICSGSDMQSIIPGRMNSNRIVDDSD